MENNYYNVGARFYLAPVYPDRFNLSQQEAYASAAHGRMLSLPMGVCFHCLRAYAFTAYERMLSLHTGKPLCSIRSHFLDDTVSISHPQFAGAAQVGNSFG
ncbi:MAG: hypothetical protein LBB73_08825, partial [Dysgonamonadaceae bacterium]|nr:hypothetical protein [Dysgonamonadaceae bacterium]